MLLTIVLVVTALVFSSDTAFAQTFSVTPQIVRQGEVLKVRAGTDAASARLASRTILLYRQSGSAPDTFGLMPVPVLTKPGIYTLEFLDEHGAILHSQAVTVRSAHYPSQNIVLSKALTNLHATKEERDEVGEFLRERLATRYWSEPLEPPLAGCITSPFGVKRLHNGKPTGDYHAGLDQRGAVGSPIRAIAAGEVKIAEQFQLRGGTVGLDHGQGLQSIYLHMSRVAVQKGTHVEAGEVIGYVGSTGRSTAPHLHWTLYANGVPVNPLQWVKLAPCPRVVKPAKQ